MAFGLGALGLSEHKILEKELIAPYRLRRTLRGVATAHSLNG